MSPKVALMLYELEGMLMCMTRPTFRNLSSTFESWASHTGQLRQIHRLEAQEFIRTRGRSLDRVIELTEKGRKLLAGPRDAERWWSEPWDGKWRVVVFDVPEKNRRLRDQLRHLLKAAHFGQLQRSVWISTRPVPDLQALIKRHADGSQRMTVMESRLVPGAEEQEVVRVAWDFREINALYMAQMDYLKSWEQAPRTGRLEERARKERQLWDDAIGRDPLLPERLLPSDYQGKEALRQRRKRLPRVLQQVI